MKNNWKRFALFGLLFIGIIVFFYSYNAYQFKNNLSKAEASLNNDDLASAITYFQTAEKYNRGISLEDKIELTTKLEDSKVNYESGINYVGIKAYEYALQCFNKVAPEDERRFQAAQTKITEVNKLIDQRKSQEEKERANRSVLVSTQKEETNEYAPQKLVDSNGKQIWKIYVMGDSLNVTAKYTGTGNFIVKLSNSNQELLDLLANEIGDYVLDKTVNVPYAGWYYLEIYGSDGSWTGSWR